MNKVFIVIPAFNEEKTIAKVIEDLLNLNYTNIALIDDGSTDETIQIASEYPIDICCHKRNCGQGAALRTGTEYALSNGADIIIHFDADGQHQVKDIEKFVNKIEDGYDIAIGSRFLNSNQKIPFTKKYFILKPGRMVNWFFSGLKLTDAHNGFRALNRQAAKNIKINQNRMAHNTEIPAEIVRHDLKYAEISVDIIYTEYGQNLKGGINIIIDLLKQKLLN